MSVRTTRPAAGPRLLSATVEVAGMRVDRTPVTNARYAEFVRQTSHRPPAFWPNGECPKSLANHPVVGVDFFDAYAFALWAGGALPTAGEWMRFADSKAPHAYAWGDRFEKGRCNTVRSGFKGTTPVDAHLCGAAPSGCLDLCGNVWELTCTRDPGSLDAVVVKGGSWYDYPAHAKLATEFHTRIHKVSATVGFRLCYGPPLRFPEFGDEELLRQCLAYRRAITPEPGHGARREDEEFTGIVEELRREAADAIPDLDRGLDRVDLAAALDILDEPGEPADEPVESAPADTSLRVRKLWRDVADFIQRRPRALFGVLLLALIAGLLLVRAAFSGPPTASRHVRSGAGAVEPVRRRARPAARTATADAPEHAQPDPSVQAFLATVEEPLRKGFADLVSGSTAVREEAERFLIWNADQAEPAVKRALDAGFPEPAQASLRYVKAAIEERRDGPGPAARLTFTGPQRGLVFFFRDVSPDMADRLEIVRRTAKAEKLPLTAVYLGQERAETLIRIHAGVLAGLRLFPDEDGAFARRWGVRHTPAVAGLRPDGRPAFLLFGRFRRTVLAQRVAGLASTP